VPNLAKTTPLVLMFTIWFCFSIFNPTKGCSLALTRTLLPLLMSGLLLQLLMVTSLLFLLFRLSSILNFSFQSLQCNAFYVVNFDYYFGS
jgi:hypothetical protein